MTIPLLNIASAESGWRWAYVLTNTVLYWPIACFGLVAPDRVEAMVADVVAEPSPSGLVLASSVGTIGSRGKLCPPGFVGVIRENRNFDIVRAPQD